MNGIDTTDYAGMNKKLEKLLLLFEKTHPAHPAVSIEDRKILKDVLNNIDKAIENSYEDITTKLHLLQTLIYNDFMEHRNPDWIGILIEHKQSPLSAHEVIKLSVKKPLSQEVTSKAMPTETVVQIQRAARSYLRREVHRNIFNAEPTTAKTLAQHPLNERYKIVIQELADSHSTVQKIHHWTVLDNLKNIFRNQSIMGNDRLKRLFVHFRQNALTYSDIANGDGNVICFCPFLVDPLALCDKEKLRSNLIRITVDPANLDSLGRYNQFFKLYDLRSPGFNYQIDITENLSVIIDKISTGENCTVTFVLQRIKASVNISREEVIFYGNLEEINYFCLIQLFVLANKIKDLHFKTELYKYLNSLTEIELKKVLICFSQGLTIFAEYNFNAVLYMKKPIIKEIYFQESNTTLMLGELSFAEYQDVINAILNKNCEDSPSDIIENVNRSNLQSSIALSHLDKTLPSELKLGGTPYNNDDLLDAVAQTLNQLRKTKMFSVKSLRTLIVEYLQRNQPTHVTGALSKDEKDAAEQEMDQHNASQTLSGPTSAANPELELPILCRLLGVKVHVIQINQTDLYQSEMTEMIVDEDACRPIKEFTKEDYTTPNMLHIVIHQNISKDYNIKRCFPILQPIQAQKLLPHLNIPKVEASFLSFANSTVSLYGNPMSLKRENVKLTNDMRSTSLEQFSGETYYESRPGLGAFQNKLVHVREEEIPHNPTPMQL